MSNKVCHINLSENQYITLSKDQLCEAHSELFNELSECNKQMNILDKKRVGIKKLFIEKSNEEHDKQIFVQSENTLHTLLNTLICKIKQDDVAIN